MATLMGPGAMGLPMFGGEAPFKTEDNKHFHASDYAYTPDKTQSTTWRLRLTSSPGGKPDPHIVGAAVAALGKGFRGNKVQIPAADLPAVKRKVLRAWHAANPDETDVPAVLKDQEGSMQGVAPPGWKHSVEQMKKDSDISNPFALCLVGDTEIPCLDGQTHTVRDLSETEEDFWVYAFDSEQFMVVPGLARARYVGIKRAYELTLDNKQKIICSAEHRWILRDGAFIPTHSLLVGMSLMPFKTMYEKGGHERVYQPGLACYVLTHWSVMRVINPGCTGGDYLIHHKNENPQDNRPDNLHWLSKLEHATWHGVENVAAMRRAWNDRFVNDPGFADGYRQRGRETATRLWADPEYRERMTKMLRAQASTAGKKAAEVHRSKAEARRIAEGQNTLFSANHKIRKITLLDQLLPMYDVAVDGYHTFAISAGVYSHNSWWMKNRGARPAKHAADMDASAEDTALLRNLTRQQRHTPPVCVAAARGEAWAQAQLLSAGYPPLVVEGRW